MLDVRPDPQEAGAPRRAADAGSQRGFSLIELMIGVAIVGLMAAVALPNFSLWMANSKVRGATESILNGIQSARAQAVRRNAQVFFQLNPDGNTLWSIGCVTPVLPPSPQECPALIEGRDLREGGFVVTRPDGTVVVTFNPTPAAGNRIIFDNFGRKLAVAANPLDFTQLDVTPVLPGADQTEARTQRIIVGAGGSARMCDPKLAAPDLRACPP